MIVLTGATGFIGSQLVRQLGAGHDLLLVSRDAAAAQSRFPGIPVCDYEALPAHDLTGAVFIHLAVRNNDRPGTVEEFRASNVDGLLDVAAVARRGGAASFINLCSTHALAPKAGDFYGLSKQEGARALAQFWPDGATNLYIPAVYSNDFQGRLAFLGRLPGALHPAVLGFLRQIKPMISIDHLRGVLLELAARRDVSEDPWRTEQYAADPVGNVGLFAAVKRMIDLMAVVAVIALLGWIMVLVAIYIRLDSKGPVIFAQRRVGRGGVVFTCYKFRTMAVGTAHAATHNVSAAAVTKAGQFLRRTKLDELPQIINVLMNEMSLVGPRPCLPLQTELVDFRRARHVLQLKPGITGLAQIGDIDMSDPARLAAWDDRYRAFRTLLGDVGILIRTVLGGGSGDRVTPSSR